MELFPTRADQPAPMWGHALGLATYQLSATMIISFLRFGVPAVGGVVGSLIASVGMAALYAVVAERKVPGSLARKGYKVHLALRASGALSLLGLLSMFFYAHANMETSYSLWAIGIPVGISFLLYFTAAWIGLCSGSKFMERRRTQKNRLI